MYANIYIHVDMYTYRRNWFTALKYIEGDAPHYLRNVVPSECMRTYSYIGGLGSSR